MIWIHKRRALRGILTTAAVLLCSAEVFASNTQPGKISNTIVTRTGRFFFDHNGSRSARPACSIYDRWVVDITTAQGQAMMALVLTAQSQGKSIIVNGQGDCRDWADTEAIDHVIAP